MTSDRRRWVLVATDHGFLGPQCGRRILSEVAAVRGLLVQWSLQAGAGGDPSLVRRDINIPHLEADSNDSAAAPVAIMMPNMPDTDMADRLECIQHSIDSIIGHRRDPDVATRFQLHIKWEDGGQTWEPECVIQLDAEETVFRYWDDVEGGRSGAMGGEDLWHPLQIEAHRQTDNGTVELKTVWVGSRERSWETEGFMFDIAHDCGMMCRI
ncbi:hypothetical protein LZ31DRAFT_547583 [Colletotrichum somersetense]|nr:hypothetical protein LZ31DRAFT_547583 [Colletotrichum somersetense]